MNQKNILPAKKFSFLSINKIFLAILLLSIVFGVGTGYTLANKNSHSSSFTAVDESKNPKIPQADKRTFRDFAQGVLEKVPESNDSNEYVEGTHILKREGAVPVALTSSVVDLSQYEGKKVKVYGETQKAIKAGWLMDVGLIEVVD